MALSGDVLVGAAAVGMSIIAFVSSRRASKITDQVAQQEVNAKAYERAQGIYETSIKQMETQVARLENRVRDLEEAMHAAGLPLPP